MKIPKVTKDKPHIEFSFSPKGELKLKATADWWGGINSGFSKTGGYEGNTCLPKDLDRYIKSFKNRKINEVKKEIQALQSKLKKLETKYK
jgi:hypothetical protein